MPRPNDMRGVGKARKFSDAGLERLLAAARAKPAREHSNVEIARACGVTDARIGQIVQEALKKLRKHAIRRFRDELL